MDERTVPTERWPESGLKSTSMVMPMPAPLLPAWGWVARTSVDSMVASDPQTLTHTAQEQPRRPSPGGELCDERRSFLHVIIALGDIGSACEVICCDAIFE